MKNCKHNEIIFPLGAKVLIKPDFHDSERALRSKVCRVVHHMRGDENIGDEPFVDNFLVVDSSGVHVGCFGNWEIELLTGDAK